MDFRVSVYLIAGHCYKWQISSLFLSLFLILSASKLYLYKSFHNKFPCDKYYGRETLKPTVIRIVKRNLYTVFDLVYICQEDFVSLDLHTSIIDFANSNTSSYIKNKLFKRLVSISHSLSLCIFKVVL